MLSFCWMLYDTLGWLVFLPALLVRTDDDDDDNVNLYVYTTTIATTTIHHIHYVHCIRA